MRNQTMHAPATSSNLWSSVWRLDSENFHSAFGLWALKYRIRTMTIRTKDCFFFAFTLYKILFWRHLSMAVLRQNLHFEARVSFPQSSSFFSCGCAKIFETFFPFLQLRKTWQSELCPGAADQLSRYFLRISEKCMNTMLLTIQIHRNGKLGLLCNHLKRCRSHNLKAN